jgi:hypothetical protein
MNDHEMRVAIEESAHAWQTECSDLRTQHEEELLDQGIPQAMIDEYWNGGL